MKYGTVSELSNGKIIRYADNCVQCGKGMIKEDGSRNGGYMAMETENNGDVSVLTLCWECVMTDNFGLVKDGATLKSGKYFIESGI